MRKLTAAITGLLALVGVSPPGASAGQEAHGVAAVALKLRQLDGVKRVLMIGAHPDDEDTGLLTALARGEGVETAYLSLSRGEGGQNLIGPRLHEGLGIVRTGELLAARDLDGGRQFFTRAFDFGYSKRMEEALNHWPMDEVLRDVVFVIRTFRPHVIVSVFSGTPQDGHGQHQIAGAASREAFDAAGDPDRYPELAQLGAAPWTPSKLYRSVRFSPGTPATLRVPTGTLDPVLGQSHFQLAMESRSRHRSQDMGSGRPMGPRESLLQLIASKTGGDADTGIFAGVDTTLFGQLPNPLPSSWPRDTGERIGAYRKAVADAGSRLSGLRTRDAVPGLLAGASILGELVGEVAAGGERGVLERRLVQVSEAALTAAGFVADVRVERSLLTPGESVAVDVTVWNGGTFELRDVVPRILLPEGWTATPGREPGRASPRSRFFRAPEPTTPSDGRVPPGGIARWSWTVKVPPSARISAPYFLEEARTRSLYTWPEDGNRWARPFDPPPIQATIRLRLALPDGEEGRLEVRREGVYVGVDKSSGEFRQPVLVVPALDVDVQPPRMVWPTGQGGVRAFTVELRNTSANERSGSLRLEAPPGWRVDPAMAPFSLVSGANRSLVFRVAPPEAAEEGRHEFRAVAVDGVGTVFDTDHDVIDHPHIRRAVLFREARAEVFAFHVAADPELRVGYIMGSGDGGAEALRQMGMNVDLLGKAEVREGAFAAYDVLVLGVRAYETRAELAAANDAVLAFARAGGTVVVQYNKYEYPSGGFAPYPVTIRRPHDRVTDETAPVTILAPESPVFSGLNRLTLADFEGWVHERGLYFPGDWDDRFTPVLEMADPGEEPKRGGLLVAPVGEGLYVYTGLAFFRQFPAGVPGAYRLFANLVSMRATDWHRARAGRIIGAAEFR